MKEFIITFTIPESVKLLSCCNSAIIEIEEKMREDNLPDIIINNKIEPKDSIEKILSIKTKIKKAIIANFGNRTGLISIKLDITDIVKLNACCNSAIETEEKTIELLDICSVSVDYCRKDIDFIYNIKNKIKSIIHTS